MDATTEPGRAQRVAELTATREFFAARAARWEERFPDDGPAFAAAVEALAPPVGGKALDAACGTGRALPFLRHAVGPGGTVIGVDLTAEMLTETGRRGRRALADVVLGDVNRLPLRDGVVDAVFAAGLIPHLGDPAGGLAELARVTGAGGRLVLFHPIGRVVLAARHGRTPDAGDIRAEPAIRAILAEAGWQTELVDDGDDRYLVVAVRCEP